MFITVKGSFCRGIIKSNAGEFRPYNAHVWADGIGYWTLRFENKRVDIIGFVPNY